MRTLVFAALFALAGTAAQAADNGIYVGGGVSQSKVDDILDTDLKIDDTAWKAIVGIRPLDFLAVEANYMDLGSESRNLGPVSVDADAKAFGAFGLLYLPLPVPFIDVYAKAGLVRWELESNSTGGLFDLDDNGTEFAYGGGAQLNFGSLSARLEYETFDIDNTDGLELVTLGLTYTFL